MNLNKTVKMLNRGSWLVLIGSIVFNSLLSQFARSTMFISAVLFLVIPALWFFAIIMGVISLIQASLNSEKPKVIADMALAAFGLVVFVILVVVVNS
jgi:hypothetical protein